MPTRPKNRSQWASAGEEAALLRQAESGHTLAFERIAWRYDEAILGLLLRLTSSEREAVELYRATFVAAYKKMALRDEPSLYLWLHRLAVTQWLKRRREQGQAGAAKLSAHEELVYTLKVGQGLGLRTVAQILERSDDTVADSFRRAVAKLRRFAGVSDRSAATGSGSPQPKS